MKFSMVHDIFGPPAEIFTEDNAPEWLCKTRTFKWFWEKYVLTLAVGASVSTDFHTITRIE